MQVRTKAMEQGSVKEDTYLTGAGNELHTLEMDIGHDPCNLELYEQMLYAKYKYQVKQNIKFWSVRQKSDVQWLQ